jgi:cell division septum initiation protein DivIVA
MGRRQVAGWGAAEWFRRRRKGRAPTSNSAGASAGAHDVRDGNGRLQDECDSLRAENRRLTEHIAKLEADAAATTPRSADQWIADLSEKTAEALWGARHAGEAIVERAQQRAADVTEEASREAALTQRRARGEAERIVRGAREHAEVFLESTRKCAEGLLAQARDVREEVLVDLGAVEPACWRRSRASTPSASSC